ncbi:unnamed protein product [Ectocarpus sp. 12 AP-2014]
MPLDTELHKAAHKGDIQSVRQLVETGEVNFNQKGAQDRTALHRAAGANHVGIIIYLLQAGAPVDTADRCLRTPLHWAAISGHLDATQLLLERGGDLRSKTVSGMNPLMCAVQQRWHSVAEAILEWSEGCTEEEEGVDGPVPSPAELCSATDAEGKTAVVFAKELGDVPMQKLLKSYIPKQPSAWCCGSGAAQQQLSAVAGPPTAEEPTMAPGHSRRSGDGRAAAAAPVSNEVGSGKAVDRGGGGGGGSGGWFRRTATPYALCLEFRSRASGTATPGATARSAESSGSATAAAAAEAAAGDGAAGMKADESRGGSIAAASGSGGSGARSIAASGSASSANNLGTNLPRSASGDGVHTQHRGGGGNNGTLAMNSPASDSVKGLSSSSSSVPGPQQTALRSVKHAPKRAEPASITVPMADEGVGHGSWEGARKSSSGGRKHRERHDREGPGGGESGMTRSKDERAGQAGFM